MNELGFFIDKKGQIKKFGEVLSESNKNTQKNNHEMSFYDEVENTDYFKTLNLKYDRDMGLYFKGIEFCLQGMILGFQNSDGSKDNLIIYIPEEITDLQKNSLTSLYPQLIDFSYYHIAIYHDLNNYTKYEDLEKLYHDYEISYTGLKK